PFLAPAPSIPLTLIGQRSPDTWLHAARPALVFQCGTALSHCGPPRLSSPYPPVGLVLTPSCWVRRSTKGYAGRVKWPRPARSRSSRKPPVRRDCPLPHRSARSPDRASRQRCPYTGPEPPALSSPARSAY